MPGQNCHHRRHPGFLGAILVAGLIAQTGSFPAFAKGGPASAEGKGPAPSDETAKAPRKSHPLVPSQGTPGQVRAQTWHRDPVDLDVTILDGGPRMLLRDPHRGAEGGNTVEDLMGQWDPGKARIIELDGGTPGDAERAAASAAFALATSWDYFEKVHGRHGYDGKGSRVRILLNNRDGDGALWEPVGEVGAIRVAVPSQFEPMVHLTILGHEFTHGVVHSRARLDRCKEARGLDEGTADFFGQMIDTWSRTGGGNPASGFPSKTIGDSETSWTMPATRRSKDGPGETILLRNMAEPALDGHPDRWFPEIGRLPDEHAVAGPLNRALCILSRGAEAVGSDAKAPRNMEVKGSTPTETKEPKSLTGAPSWSSDLLPGGMTGIGNDRTAAIWYAVVTEELQPMSDYRDARKAALKVARRLYGEESREDFAVRDAFGAVGVGKPGRLSDPADAWLPAVVVKAEPAGEDLVLTVTVPDPAQVKSVAFLVDGAQVGKAAASPFRLSLPASSLLANGARRFQAALQDVEDNVVQSKEVGFTLANRMQQLVVDPGLRFEDESAGGWLSEAILERPALPPPGEVADGWCRRFDAATLRPGRYPILTLQGLVLPSAPVHLQLSLWVQVPASSTPAPDDELIIRVQPNGAMPTQTFARLTPTAPTDGWVYLSFPLDGFAGQSVHLQFESRFKEASTTVFRVADVRILASSEPIPAPAEPVREPGCASSSSSSTSTSPR